jgi:hypothetical protein
MALELFDKFGRVSVATLGEQLGAIVALNDDQQAKVSALVTAVENREAAAERFNRAVIGVTTATQEQEAAHAAHLAANPALSFLDARRAAIDAFNRSN